MTTDSKDWTLIVNGDPKPWPIKDYLNREITIDLNWGIDTTIYKSEPLTFCVSRLLDGVKVEGVTVDMENRVVKCEIPIEERSKDVKVIVDWSALKKSIKSDLKAEVDGKPIAIENGSIHLVGEEIVSPIEFYFEGVKCETSEVNEMNMIQVVLPYSHQSSAATGSGRNSSKRRVWIGWLAMLFVGFLLGYMSYRPRSVVKIEYAEPKTDTVLVSQSLDIARQYLARDYWRRDEMELIPELQGLYDDMVYYRFDKVRGRLDSPKFRDAGYVGKLLKSIPESKEYLSSRWTDNKELNIEKYIHWIEILGRGEPISSPKKKIGGLK